MRILLLAAAVSVVSSCLAAPEEPKGPSEAHAALDVSSPFCPYAQQPGGVCLLNRPAWCTPEFCRSGGRACVVDLVGSSCVDTGDGVSSMETCSCVPVDPGGQFRGPPPVQPPPPAPPAPPPPPPPPPPGKPGGGGTTDPCPPDHLFTDPRPGHGVPFMVPSTNAAGQTMDKMICCNGPTDVTGTHCCCKWSKTSETSYPDQAEECESTGYPVCDKGGA